MIKGAILAAVTAVGIGAAAEAATVTSESYQLTLRYEGTSYDYFEYIDLITYETFVSETVAVGDAPAWFKPLLFSNLDIGDLVQFSALINYLNPPDYDFDFGNGGTAPICSVGMVSCTNTNLTKKSSDGRIELAYSDRISIETNAKIGGYLVYSNWTFPETYRTDDGRYMYNIRFQNANFSIVQPAPVPLPASVVLLPLGLGALALMRRRRKVS